MCDATIRKFYSYNSYNHKVMKYPCKFFANFVEGAMFKHKISVKFGKVKLFMMSYMVCLLISRTWAKNIGQNICSIPIVISEELWVSKNLLRWCHTLGIHLIILTRSSFLVWLEISVSTSFLLRYLARNPFTGSMWFAYSTQRKLWCNCKSVVEHVDWFIVPIMYGL